MAPYVGNTIISYYETGSILRDIGVGVVAGSLVASISTFYYLAFTGFGVLVIIAGVIIQHKNWDQRDKVIRPK